MGDTRELEFCRLERRPMGISEAASEAASEAVRLSVCVCVCVCACACVCCVCVCAECVRCRRQIAESHDIPTAIPSGACLACLHPTPRYGRTNKVTPAQRCGA